MSGSLLNKSLQLITAMAIASKAHDALIPNAWPRVVLQLITPLITRYHVAADMSRHQVPRRESLGATGSPNFLKCVGLGRGRHLAIWG
jgi:hypothetical protein